MRINKKLGCEQLSRDDFLLKSVFLYQKNGIPKNGTKDEA